MALRARLAPPLPTPQSVWPYHKVKIGSIAAHILFADDRRMEAETYLSSGYGIRMAIQSKPKGWGYFRQLAKVWMPNRLKGILVSPEYGNPFFAATQVFDVRPIARKFLALEKMSGAKNCFVQDGLILVTRSGSVGRPALTHGPHRGVVISDDLLRVEAIDPKDRGWLYAYLLAPQTRAMTKSAHYGHIIKHLETSHLDALPIPSVVDATALDFSKRVAKILELRNEGYRLTLEAEAQFEKALGSLAVNSWDGIELVILVGARLYDSDEYVAEGDFSERLSGLLQHITDHYQAQYGVEFNQSLTQQEITQLLYQHDVNKLKDQIVDYLRVKNLVLLLFDNIDKGWPTHGLTAADVSIVRALLEATRKLERHLQRKDVQCSTLAFLRNDVYELLVSETPDRGKEGHVALDWSDADLLREVIRRRLVYSGLPERPFDDLWQRICVSHVAGEESAQFLIDRCLMRPRGLIDLANYCRGFAVNLGHTKIEVSDIQKGISAFSSDLIKDIGYEIRDVLPQAENVLYAFIDEAQTLPEKELYLLLERGGVPRDTIEPIVNILLWYGVLGVRRIDGSVSYIYNVNYEMPVLSGIIQKLKANGLVFVVNPAFIPGLQIREDRA